VNLVLLYKFYSTVSIHVHSITMQRTPQMLPVSQEPKEKTPCQTHYI
jgi:hypothetical protein